MAFRLRTWDSRVNSKVNSCSAASNIWRRTDGLIRLNQTAGASGTDAVVFPLANTEGAGSRFMIDPSVDPVLPSTAVRGGRVTGPQWDFVNRGLDSVAFGLDVVASGTNSMALGTDATASKPGSLVWGDSTATAQTSLNANEVTFGASGGFRVLAGGASVPAYVGGEIYLDAAETVVTGKLTVTGLIDPTGIVFQGQDAVPEGAPPTGKGTYWCTSTNPTTPQFTSVTATTALQVGATPGGAFENLVGLTVARTAAANYAASNSFVFGSQSMDFSNSASSVRMFFNKPKAAFRAGADTSGVWNDAQLGVASVALGLNTAARGSAALAIGRSVSAAGNQSVAMGAGTANAVNDNTLMLAMNANGTSVAANDATVLAAGGFRAVGNGASSPAYEGGQIYLDCLETVMTGDLSVTGVVSAGRATLGVSATVPSGAPPAGSLSLWTFNTTPSTVEFTDSAALDQPVGSPFELSGAPGAYVIRQNASFLGYSVADTSFLIGSAGINSGNPGSDGFFFLKPSGAMRCSRPNGAVGQGSFANGFYMTASGTASFSTGAQFTTAGADYTWAAGVSTAVANQMAVRQDLTVLGGDINLEMAMVQSRNATVPTTPGGSDGIFWTKTDGAVSQPAYTDSVGNEYILSASAFINTAGVTLSDATSPDYAPTNSFVFGTQSLDGAGSRFQLDKSNGSFRAGSASATQWDTRPAGSVAIGIDGVSSGADALSLGGSNVTAANAFGWSDSTVRAAAVPESVVWGASNGVRIFSDAGATPGVELSVGGVAWTSPSDRNMKENLVEMSGVLERVEALPIYEYNYKGQDKQVVCRGPMAQDWHKLFPSDKDPLRIDTMDLDGVALAAVRELSTLLRKLTDQVSG